ncbi:MAG TPA: YetF domain-containing protein [Roseiflexaceae bacterium]|nr:YetF domain-containing protein [Roseiflexaceae bacterium]
MIGWHAGAVHGRGTCMWNDMLVVGVPLAEKALRTLIVYAFLIICLRLAGKRELAQLNSFDLVVLLLLSNTVQNAIIGNDNSLVGGLFGATMLIFINWILVRVSYKYNQFDRLLEGDPVKLVQNGQLLEDQCAKQLITRMEIEIAARKQGFDSLADVREAMLEPGGALTFAGKEPSLDETHYRDLVARLDRIAQRVEALHDSQRVQP